MKENIKEINTIFYNNTFSAIPKNIINDFRNNSFFVIFVNPKSGSLEGNIILKYIKKYKAPSIPNYNIIHFPINKKNWLQSFLKSQNLEEKIIKGGDYPTNFDPLISFSIIIFNIMDLNEFESGKIFIKNYLKDYPEVELKILIAGGDGSVLSIVEDLHKDKIEIGKCIFGAMPLGTGNDLSNSMGFNAKCQIGTIYNFQKVLYNYFPASVVNIDIWKMQLKVDKNEGKIFDLIPKGEIEIKDESNKNVTYFKKTFINYMSLGFDAEVGFMFGQRRSGSRLINKMIYGIEAAKIIFKGLFIKRFGLLSILENLISFKGENLDSKMLSNDDNYFIDEEFIGSFNNKKIIFDSVKLDKKNNYNKTILKGNPQVIICQNIHCYMGGTPYIWGKSKQIGKQVCGLKRSNKKIYEKNIENAFLEQTSNDKKIETLLFDHGMQMGFEKVFRGRAKKLEQDSGPYLFTFKKKFSNRQENRLNNVYLNIDGEFYHLNQPKQILLSLNNDICNGQIKFFKNEIAIWKRKQENISQKIFQFIEDNKLILILVISIVLLLKYKITALLIFLTYILLLFL